MRIALTIAGSDSGGGAGIQADLKTFHQFGVFGTSVICAVTAQNTTRVRAWEALPAALVARQLDAVAEDLPPAAVKTGMLGTGELIETVGAGLARHRLPNYVLVTAGEAKRFSRPRIDTSSTHGTGCTLSAAVTAGLAHGRPLLRAVEDALDFVQRALAAAPGLGAGHGPLNHFVPAPPRPPT